MCVCTINVSSRRPVKPRDFRLLAGVSFDRILLSDRHYWRFKVSVCESVCVPFNSLYTLFLLPPQIYFVH